MHSQLRGLTNKRTKPWYSLYMIYSTSTGLSAYIPDISAGVTREERHTGASFHVLFCFIARPFPLRCLPFICGNGKAAIKRRYDSTAVVFPVTRHPTAPVSAGSNSRRHPMADRCIYYNTGSAMTLHPNLSAQNLLAQETICLAHGCTAILPCGGN